MTFDTDFTDSDSEDGMVLLKCVAHEANDYLEEGQTLYALVEYGRIQATWPFAGNFAGMDAVALLNRLRGIALGGGVFYLESHRVSAWLGVSDPFERAVALANMRAQRATAV